MVFHHVVGAGFPAREGSAPPLQRVLYIRRSDEDSSLTPPVVFNTKPVTASSHKTNLAERVLKAVLSAPTAYNVGSKETASQFGDMDTRLLSNSL